MYAIFVDGGRQYKVEEGQQIEVDYREVPTGGSVVFDRVLAYNDGTATQLGRPTLDGAAVTGEVLGPCLGPKIVVQKYRRRKNYRRRTGHRQLNTKVRIRKIDLG